jgi:predicted DNA-binding WGR domain protein
MAKTKRSFVYSDEKSNKFWNIEIDGKSYTVNYGKVGTNGQTVLKDFDTEEACQKAVDKLVKEKTGKGYKEEGGVSNEE